MLAATQVFIVRSRSWEGPGACTGLYKPKQLYVVADWPAMWLHVATPQRRERERGPGDESVITGVPSAHAHAVACKIILIRIVNAILLLYI